MTGAQQHAVPRAEQEKQSSETNPINTSALSASLIDHLNLTKMTESSNRNMHPKSSSIRIAVTVDGNRVI